MPVVICLAVYCLLGLAATCTFFGLAVMFALFDSWRMAAAERAARRDEGRRIPVARTVRR